jgi:hypothetical protein
MKNVARLRRGEPARCGTNQGYYRHLRDGTIPCPGCCGGRNAYRAERKMVGMCAPGLGWPLLPVQPSSWRESRR